MRGFTRQEQKATLLLLFVFGMAVMVWLYRQSRPLPAVNPAVMATFDEYVRALAYDTVDTLSPANVLGDKAKQLAPASSRLDLNAATEADLMRLPGIGPVMAKRILEYRQMHGSFKRLEELRKVKGIGAKTYAKLAPLLVVK